MPLLGPSRQRRAPAVGLLLVLLVGFLGFFPTAARADGGCATPLFEPPCDPPTSDLTTYAQQLHDGLDAFNRSAQGLPDRVEQQVVGYLDRQTAPGNQSLLPPPDPNTLLADSVWLKSRFPHQELETLLADPIFGATQDLVGTALQGDNAAVNEPYDAAMWAQNQTEAHVFARITPLNAVRTDSLTSMVPDFSGDYLFRVDVSDDQGNPFPFTDWRVEVSGLYDEPSLSDPGPLQTYRVGSYGADLHDAAPRNDGGSSILVQVPAWRLEMLHTTGNNLVSFTFLLPSSGGDQAFSYSEPANLALSMGIAPAFSLHGQPTPILLLPELVSIPNEDLTAFGLVETVSHLPIP